MKQLMWTPVLLAAVLLGCLDDPVDETGSYKQVKQDSTVTSYTNDFEPFYTKVTIPAQQINPDADDILFDGIEGIAPYWGVTPIHVNTLLSDVVARVSLSSKRTSVVQFSPANWGITWLALLEFRFQVHEYIKGSGPNEIGGFVFLINDTEAEARAIESQIVSLHDSRWDSREAIVFLARDPWAFVDLSSIQLGTDQYWFGNMVQAPRGGNRDGYTVASWHDKLWLPEATTNAVGGRSTQNKLFLLDVPSTVTTSGKVPGGSTAVIAPTISLSNLKNSIATVEAEANQGGTDEYRECVIRSRIFVHRTEFAIENTGGGKPWLESNYDLMSGLPAGQVIFEIKGDWLTPERRGRGWINGPDKEVVRYTAIGRRIETTRPLPGGEYVYYQNWKPPLFLVCDRDESSIEDYRVTHLHVTSPPRTLHEAFFDPVDIGSSVGADGANGVLDPASFALGGVTTAVASLKWDSGTVTMGLSPTASLADYAIDFIDVKGTTTLSLSSDSVGPTGLTWAVPDKPWADGDLLMLRIHKPISNDATLSSLTLSGVDLAFDPATTTYAASVPATTTQTTVTPTTNHDSATYVVKLAGVVDLDGTIPLAAGDNVITIDVTAEDGVTTEIYTVTITRATPAAPVTVTLTPRVDGSSTYVNITIEWNDPQTCDGQYLVALYTSSDYMVQFLGYTPASETPSRTTESATDWGLSRFPDWFAGVTCYPNASSEPARDLGRVSLRDGHTQTTTRRGTILWRPPR